MNRRRTTKLIKSKYSPKGRTKSRLRVVSCFLYIGIFISGFSFVVFYYSHQQPNRLTSTPTSLNEVILEYYTFLSSYLFLLYVSPIKAGNDLYHSKLRGNDSDSLTTNHRYYSNNNSISQSPPHTVFDECVECGEQELSFLTVARVQYALSKHPFRHKTFQHYLNNSANNGVFTLISYIKYLYEHPACRRYGVQLPVFVSMANVYSDLYWQL